MDLIRVLPGEAIFGEIRTQQKKSGKRQGVASEG
jgi:hypothetical protein